MIYFFLRWTVREIFAKNTFYVWRKLFGGSAAFSFFPTSMSFHEKFLRTKIIELVETYNFPKINFFLALVDREILGQNPLISLLGVVFLMRIWRIFTKNIVKNKSFTSCWDLQTLSIKWQLNILYGYRLRK